MNRRRLFSETPQRRKLFSEEIPQVVNESSETTHILVCQDCGYKMETGGNTTNVCCPKCGGTRFSTELEVFSPEGTPEPVKETKTYSIRRSIFDTTEEDFQKVFAQTSDPLELKLKKFSGRTLDSDYFEREFSGYASKEDLEERGFAEIKEDGKVSISSDAFYQSRLFSKLVISVTKTLELDPEIMCPGCNREGAIEKLENNGNMSPKCIMLIRKAHGIVPTHDDNDNWIKDSGIANDIPLEFGGQNKPVIEFKKTLDDRYPDAPEDIIELLKKKGIITINGEDVNINK